MQRILLAAACFMLLASCEMSTGPSALEGTISFTYIGGGGGAFSTIGVAPANPEFPGNSDWAAAFQETGFTSGAGVRFEGATYDIVFFGITRVTTGTEAVDADCNPEAADCTGFFFLINGEGELFENFEFICTLLTGSFTITDVTATRVRGTFSGTGECLDLADSASAFTVSSGSFDVPLIPEP